MCQGWVGGVLSTFLEVQKVGTKIRPKEASVKGQAGGWDSEF